MRSSLATPILIAVVSIIQAGALEDEPLCCGNKSIPFRRNEDWTYQCGIGASGQKPMIPCNTSDMRMLNYAGEDYIYQTDDDGKQMYVDSFSIVHSPYYCVGNFTHIHEPARSKVIIACRSEIIFRNRPVVKDIIFTVVALLFLVSGIFSALTAAIYFSIPQTQDIEGKCTFHLTLNQSLIYLFGSYWCLRVNTMEVNVLDEFCISHWYFFIFVLLSFFAWSAILAFHLRSRFRQNRRTDESKLMHRYLIIGYGIPATLVLVSNIHIYGFHDSDLATYCGVHRHIMFRLYAALPIFVSQLACAFFFVSLQRQLWNAQPANAPSHSTSQLKKFKFRFLLNAKLFVLTGLPYLLIVICVLLSAVTSHTTVFKYLITIIFYFIACEGAVVFYMLVASRKRILRGVAGMFGVTVTGWEPCPESEESIAYSNENENELGREL